MLFMSAIGQRVQAQDTTRKQDTVRDEPTFIKVEIEAEFPGGSGAWLHYLSKNLRYPNAAVRHNLEGTVVVQFLVDKQGKISDIQAIAGPSQDGLREEAVRLVAGSRFWVPAVQNGRQVRSYKKVPIVFRLANND